MTSSAVRSSTATRSGLLLVGLVLIGANLRAGITAVGPVLGDIRSDLGISGVASSVLISTPLVMFAIFSPFAPAVARRVGTERALGASLVALAFAIVIRSVPIAGAIWIGTALLGIAIAFMNVLLPAVVKRDFPDRVGTVTGIYSSAQSIAAAIAAGVAVPIAGVAQHGWRLSIGIWAGLAIIAFALFLPRLRARPDADAGEPVNDRTQHQSPLKSAIGWQVTLFMGLQSTVYYSFITWWPSVEQEHGVSATAAGFHQFVFQMFGIAGSLIAATLINRLPDQGFAVALLAVLIFIGVGGELVIPALALVWVVLAGMSVGGTIVLALSMFGLRTVDHRQAAALSAMAQTIGYMLAATGPILIGLLHDTLGSWTFPIIVLLVIIAAQATFGVLAGRDRKIGEVR